MHTYAVGSVLLWGSHPTNRSHPFPGQQHPASLGQRLQPSPPPRTSPCYFLHRETNTGIGMREGCGSKRGERGGRAAAVTRATGLHRLPAVGSLLGSRRGARAPPQHSAGLQHPRLHNGHGRSGRNPVHLEEKEGGRVCQMLCFQWECSEQKLGDFFLLFYVIFFLLISMCQFIYLFVFKMGKLISVAQVMRAGGARLHANPESAVCLSL